MGWLDIEVQFEWTPEQMYAEMKRLVESEDALDSDFLGNLRDYENSGYDLELEDWNPNDVEILIELFDRAHATGRIYSEADDDEHHKIVFDGIGGHKIEFKTTYYGDVVDHIIDAYNDVPEDLKERLIQWKIAREI